MGKNSIRCGFAVLLACLLCVGLLPVDVRAEGTGDMKPVMSADGKKMTGSVASVDGDYVPGTWSGDAKAAAAEICGKLGDEELAGQLFILKRSPNGGKDFDMSTWVDGYHPAGFLFTSEDWGGNAAAAGVAKYVDGYQEKARISFIAAVDQEGGKVDRLGLGSKSQLELAAEGGQAVYGDGAKKAGELASRGLNLAFAPVADVALEAESYMYGRTYGKGYEGTADCVGQAVSGLEANGAGSCLKHFPGYGDAPDSHSAAGVATAARSDRTEAQILAEDIKPFKAGRANGNSMVMVNHVVYPMTHGLSASVCPDVYAMLREQLGNDCVAVTDSMSMKVAVGGRAEDEVCLMALEAGADLVITKYPETQYPAVLDAVKTDPEFKAQAKEKAIRVLSWKIEHGIVDPDLVDAKRLTGVYNTGTLEDALKASAEASEDTVVIPVTKDFIVTKNVGPLVPAGKKIVIDLGGFVITSGSDKSGAEAFKLTQSGQHLVIQNGTIAGVKSNRSFLSATKPNISVEFKNLSVNGFDNTLKNSGDHDGAFVFASTEASGFALAISGCSFFKMHAERNGGVAYCGGKNGSIELSDSSFVECKAHGDGGVIYLADGSSVSVSKCTFGICGSETGDGGAIRAARSAITLSGSTFTDCSAGKNGGAVFGTSGGSKVVVRDGCRFVECTAGARGGAVNVGYGTLDINGSMFEGCHASRGGAVSSYNDMNPKGLGSADKWSTIWGPELGDGLGKDDAKPSDLDGLPADLYWETRVSDTSFLDCYAEGSGAGEGGAIWTENKYSLFEGISIDGGAGRGVESMGNGGGIYVSKDGRAVSRAALVEVDGEIVARRCVIKDCKTSSHKPGNESQTRNGGGGIFGNGDLYLADTDITGCKSEGAGGGVLWQSDDAGHVLKMTGCTVEGNYARNGEGGGMFLGCGRENGEGKAYVARSEIRNNTTDTTAHWGGGGLFLRHNCHLYMSRAVVTRNTADGLGGGVAGCPTSHTLVYAMADASVAGNTAKGTAKPSNVSDKYNIDAEGESLLSPHAQDFFCINQGGVTGGKWASGWSAADRLEPAEGQAVPGSLLDGNGMIECGATGWLGLTSALDPDAYVVVDECAVVIDGNHSAMNGGGIGCNGSIDVYTSDGVVPGLQFPDTGGIGTAPFVLAGSVAMFFAVLFMTHNHRKRRSE